MSRFRFSLISLAIMVLMLASASGAHAQATRTWVSGVGDDANPCSRTAPCKTFAGAISKTAVNGEINCLDPGGFGVVTITKSITIDCHEIFSSILNASTTGVIINFSSFQASDSRKSVRLRNLSINGASTGLNGIRIIGASFVTSTKVWVEDSLIDGQLGTPGRGIQDFRQGGGLLFVNNTTIRNVTNAAVSVDPTADGGTSGEQINVTISNSHVSSAGSGLNFGSNVKASIFNTVVTRIAGAGVFAIQNSSGTTEIAVDHCVISSNSIGVNASTASTIIRVSNSTLMYNNTLFSAVGGGQVFSYGNNHTGGLVLGAVIGQN